ncbi:response regulator transcription factor [Bacillus cereus group sp. BfR-BA-01380]|uniref:response regulator transcription factor n=1 Tax=Bacillus cereus group sp. BfR-BA-01380 TaxID=2920324 RepID=UPI001F5721AF|nr:response regulator transcription factor [Bacillus cereus group sp. BfR-BA-01380]
MVNNILIVDDEEEIMEMLQDFLEVEGYRVFKATNGEDAKRIFDKINIDMILLDIMMNNESGFSICKKFRAESNVPIIFLSALQNDVDKIRGLNIGADDYIVKSATPGEIIARIKAIERRLNQSFEKQNNKIENEICYKNIRLNIDRREVYINNGMILLTVKEFEILKLFLVNPNQVMTYEQILEKVWGYEQGDNHAVRVYIAKLREKLEKSTNQIKIYTVWGIGYKFGETDE